MDINDILPIINELPPDLQKINRILSENDFSKEELAILANEAVGNCFCEFKDVVGSPMEHGFDPKFRTVHIENLYSHSLEQVLRCLLRHGYDPNVTVDDDNAFCDLQYVDTPDVGASCMRLLLENGADPNRKHTNDPDTLFEFIAFKVSYDEYSHRLFNTVQCWLVLMGFGGCWKDGSIPVEMLNGHSVEIFKQFELFDYSIEDLPDNRWRMNIFNTRTGEIVAQY